MIALVVFLGFIIIIVVIASVFTSSVVASFLGGMLTVVGLLVKMKPEVANPGLLREVKCHQVAKAPGLAESNAIIKSVLQNYLSQSTPRFKLWQNQENGNFGELYSPRPKTLNSRELENLRDSYNVALIDLSRVKAANQRFNFSGPVFIYSSQTEDLEAMMLSMQGLRVTSRTAVIYCNEGLPSTRLAFDTPLVVASEPLDRQVMLMNVSTPGHPTIRIAYNDVLEKLIDLLQIALRISKEPGSMTKEKTESIFSEIRHGMPKSPAPPQPIHINFQQSERIADAGTQADLWQQTNCRFSWGVKCRLTLTRDMLQKFVMEAFAKEGGVKKSPIQAGPLRANVFISKPAVYLKDGRFGIVVDVEVQREISGAKLGTIVAAVLPEKFTLRDVSIDGKLRYEDSKGEIFFQDPEVVSFQVEPALQAKVRPYESAIKAALNQALKPLMDTKPVYEFRKQSGAVGTFGNYVLENIETIGNQSLILHLKLL